MTEPGKIDGETMREMLKAADGMGISKGQQDFSGQPIKFNLVNAFSTHFGQWAVQGNTIIAQLFPRAGEADVFYDARYPSNGYVPGRLELLPKGLSFPDCMEEIVKEACNKVTFGDVELDRVQELGAWVVRFRDCEPMGDWMKQGGLLEQFFVSIDDQLDPE